jgi:phosphoribosyl-ATP pyrophosphohydrolase/phosphoribosyl-AMP cyclohydrolase
MNIMHNNPFTSPDQLLPVIIQNVCTGQVLMLGYMNEEALLKTKSEGKVTFYSRSKKRLWTKGETSGNFLDLRDYRFDCDQDAILMKVEPRGATCHTGSDSCFGEDTPNRFLFLLEEIINRRIATGQDESYTYTLYKKGIPKMAQKLGEEAVELVIEALGHDVDAFKNEAADLLFHFLLLLQSKNIQLKDIESVLEKRHLVKR